MRKQSVVHGMREVVTGRRTAGGKRKARSASRAARSKSSGQGFAALTGRSSLYRVGRRQLRRTGSSIARGRRWLNELIADPTANAASIATRDGCSVRKVNMTISLAFLAPDLVKAAIEGRLPHGMGVVRLADLPAEWSRQHQMLRLPAQ